MNRLILLFTLALFACNLSFGQLKEGHISYKMEVSTDNPDMEMAVMMFQGSTLDLYFSGNVASSEMNMGSMMSMTTVVNNESGKILMLMGGMVGNKAVLTDADEISDGQEEEEITPDIKLTDETKKILGYTCKKAIISDTSGTEMIYWYTEEIKTLGTDKNSTISKLPGQAMQYSTNANDMVMTFTAVKVETTLDDDTVASKLSFDVPAGYDLITYEEFSSLGGGF